MKGLKFLIVLVGWVSSAGLGFAAEESSADPKLSPMLELRPLLKEYCFDCHGNRRQKADLNLEQIATAEAFLEQRKRWQRVHEMVLSREMPPEDRPQPSEDQRALILSRVESGLSQLDCDEWVTPGRVTIRRLNRAEYNNTIRDLIGIDFQPAEDFPQDEVGHGFDNIGDLLSIPPILMEKYLDAAEEIAARAIVTDYPPAAPVRRLDGEMFKGDADEGSLRPVDGGALGLYREAIAFATFETDAGGEFDLRVRAYGDQAGLDAPRLAVRVDDEVVGERDVKAVRGEKEVYSLKVKLAPGTHRIGVAYLNNYNVQDHPVSELNGDRNLFVDFVEIEGPTNLPPPPLPESHTRIITRQPRQGQERECAEEILERFASRAYRRPATEEEVKRLADLADWVRSDGGSFEEGIQWAIQAALVSPNFLFRWELDPGSVKGPARSLNDYELASRLSYFLWSSMPDAELFELAEQGKLREEETLRMQALRMLQDPKSKALVTNFAGQWLQTRNLSGVTPDPDLFPEFDPALRAAMKSETELYFEVIMREDRSVLEFIDGDFTFLNERLARHYGIPGVEGPAFRRVALSEGSPRGGVLTQGSILTLTSNPTRTSPVNRGKWILEQILGTPPPPPPPNVGELPEDEAAIEAASLRERLEIHRAKPECATCHAKMDPIGFAFENFDAVGAWRDFDGRFPVDPSGTLPNGTAIDGPASLKAYLKGQDTFVRTLIEKMLTYALGRGLEYYDTCTVDRIYEEMVENEHKFSTLVAEIVTSAPFQMQEVEGDQS